jgi:hypothetical protein
MCIRPFSYTGSDDVYPGFLSKGYATGFAVPSSWNVEVAPCRGRDRIPVMEVFSYTAEEETAWV